jgi:hypothetical protein
MNRPPCGTRKPADVCCRLASSWPTAKTVIDALEDAEDFAAFEIAVTVDSDAQSAVACGAPPQKTRSFSFSLRAVDRLSRYEATLWRQACQVLFTLQCLDRRKP